MIPREEREIINSYMVSIKKIPLLSKEEQLAIAAEYQKTKDPELSKKLVNCNLRFVVMCAHKFKNYGVSFLDLVQAGNEGLLHSVDKFDPSRDLTFYNYAGWWIKAYMHKLVQKNHSIVRYGKTELERQLFYRLRGAQDKLEKSGCDDVDGQLCKMYQLTLPELQKVRQRITVRDVSLDLQMGEDSDTNFVDSLSSGEDCEQEYQNAEMAQQIEYLIKKAELNECQEFIVRNRLMGDECKLQEVGDKFGFSRERARQVEVAAIKKLKQTFIRHKAEL